MSSLFIYFCSFYLLTLLFVILRPDSDYIGDIQASDYQNESKQPRNGHLDLQLVFFYEILYS